MKKYRFWNIYLTATISITMVLILVGMECIVWLGSRQLVQQLENNVTLTVVLKEMTDSTQVARFSTLMDVAPYCHSYRYISKQEALEEHIASLGEDPTLFLGYNPLSASFEVQMEAGYAHTDSMAVIRESMLTFPYVDKVIYPEDMVKVLESNISEVSLVLIGLAVILLIISFALIVNTIRLHVYSKRFLINTMRLVGATPWVIKRPIIGTNMLMGFVASLLAIACLVPLIVYFERTFGVMLFEITWHNIAILTGVVMAIGLLITLLASWFAVTRYVRMKIERMYTV